jgi:hypothetical protein
MRFERDGQSDLDLGPLVAVLNDTCHLQGLPP